MRHVESTYLAGDWWLLVFPVEVDRAPTGFIAQDEGESEDLRHSIGRSLCLLCGDALGKVHDKSEQYRQMIMSKSSDSTGAARDG